MFLNPIGADTGLWLRPVEYERKAGITLKKHRAVYFQMISADNYAKKHLKHGH